MGQKCSLDYLGGLDRKGKDMRVWWTNVDEETNAEVLVEIMTKFHNGDAWRGKHIARIWASGCYVKVDFYGEESLVLKISAEG